MKRTKQRDSMLVRVLIGLMLSAACELALGDTVVIRPVWATATTTSVGHPFLMIDGSGLTDWTNPGDVTTKNHESVSILPVNYWQSALNVLNNGTTSTTEVLTFTLPAASTVDRIHQWPYYNSTAPGYNQRGIKTCDISFSTDGGNTYPVTISAAALGNFTAATGAPIPSQTKVFTAQNNVTHIKLSNIQVFANLNGYIQVPEIRFGGTGTFDHARDVDVANPSFELPDCGALTYLNFSPYGWRGGFTANETLGDFDASHGAQVLGLKIDSRVTNQMLSEQILDGIYTLTVDAGLRATDSAVTVTASLYVGDTSNIVASRTVGNLPVDPTNNWKGIEVAYSVSVSDINLGKHLGIMLLRTGGTKQVILDNVHLAYTNANVSIINVNNASFESPELASGTFTSTVSDWLKSGANAWIIDEDISRSPSASDGKQMASVTDGILSQTLPQFFIVDRVYTLTVDAAQRGSGSTGAVVLYAEGEGGVRTPLATATDANLPVNPAEDGWRAMTVQYAVSPGDPNIGSLVGVELKRTSGNQQVAFDNVRMTLTAKPPQGTVILVY